MQGFLPYVRELEGLLFLAADSTASVQKRLEPALNGEASRELRRRVPLKLRRASGAFFTGSDLAAQLLALSRVRKIQPRRYYDPTCGAGDLLLQVARRLPRRDTVTQTLKIWGRRLV